MHGPAVFKNNNNQLPSVGLLKKQTEQEQMQKKKKKKEKSFGDCLLKLSFPKNKKDGTMRLLKNEKTFFIA
jgi:hypothetical protein